VPPQEQGVPPQEPAVPAPGDAQPTEPQPVAPAGAQPEAVAEPTLPLTEQTTTAMPVVPAAEDVTAVAPVVPAVEEATAVTPVVPDQDLVAPPTDTDQTLSDTSDFTLSDITLGDAGGGRLTAWFRGLRSRPASADGTEAAQPVAPSIKSRHWGLRSWQWALIGVGAVVFILALLVAIDGGLYYGKVHHGISVAGQNLSGMTSGKATADLAVFTEEAQKQPITLESDDGAQTWNVLPSDLGTTIDIPAAVTEAMDLTRKGNVFVDLSSKLQLYFAHKDYPLQGTVDSGKMDALLNKIAAKLDVPAVNATLVVNNGSIEVVDGKQGTVVDKEALRSSLTNLLFTLHDTKLTVPMVTTDPDLSKVDVEPALAQAQAMVGGNLEVTFKGKTIATLTPAEIVTYVDIASNTGSQADKTVPVLSAAKMTALFDSLNKQVSTPGVNAGFEMDFNTEPYSLKLVEGVNGEGLDPEATAAAFTQAAMSATNRTAEVVLMAVEPEITTAEVQAMGIKDVLGDYKTSPYVGTKGRQQNVRLATKLCSGVFLAPGEEFNTDQRLGVRDASHGWALAPGIVGPGKLEDVFGGGICQVSTTLFNAALLAGLEITKRYNHSIYINHYPDGRDATVTAGGKNMCFRNDTDHYIFVYGWSSGINTHFWIWGVADGRKVQPIQFSGFSVGGAFPVQTVINTSLPLGATEESFAGQRSRSCSITRTVIYADGTSKSVTWESHWSMMAQVIETNPKPATTTTHDTTSTTAAPVTSTTLGP
jgi:vancomycin resistance protein YoaR